MFPGACFQFALLWGSWLWPVLHSCVEYMCLYLKCVGFVLLCSILSFRDLHMIGRCMFYGKGGPLRGCESSFVHLDFFLASRDARRTNWRGKQVSAVGPSARGFLINAGEEVQFFCTDVTLFAHSRQVKTFRRTQLGISEPGFTPAGIYGPWKAFTLPRYRASWGQ